MSERADCPRCEGTPLGRGHYEQVPAFLCGACQGLLVRRRDLRRLLDAMVMDVIETIHPDRALAAVPDAGPIGCCPACGGATDHYGYLGSSLVMLDGCDACDGVWVDPQELAAMSELFARTEKRRLLAEREAERREREFAANMDVAALANAVRGRLRLGFVFAADDVVDLGLGGLDALGGLDVLDGLL